MFILAKPAGTSFAGIPFIIPTAPGDNKVVTTKKETNPARAADPFLSLDIPNATPIANRIGILSIIAPPDLIKKAANTLSPPHPTGSIQYPKPNNIAAAGRTATGTISALPLF